MHQGKKLPWGLSFPGVMWLVCWLGWGSIEMGWALSDAYILRFSDTPALQQGAVAGQAAVPVTPTAEPDSPVASANDWLQRQGWKQAWPRWPLGGRQELFFAGPHTQRYLRVYAKNAYYIWTHQLDLDIQRRPVLAVTWGIERFPEQAALDVYKRNDRALVLIVSFGAKVASGGLLPDVPRALAFFWGETDTVGTMYTCIPPRHGPVDVRMQCQYPHVKYIALRRGGAGSVHTDQVNLLEQFQRHFPDYWQEQQRLPPVTAVSFEARSDLTDSVSSARLYAVAFTAAPGPHGQGSGRAQERQ
jgi:hypothetical protein